MADAERELLLRPLKRRRTTSASGETRFARSWGGWTTALAACLWSRWTDPTGEHPDLLSLAAITDDPEPEVAAAGHYRTIINIKPERVDAWLNADPTNLQALYDIFDDKQHR